MNRNLKIGYDQKGYNATIERITNAANIYINASKELEKLKVKNIKSEDLLNGGFMDVFMKHQKNEYDNSASAKELDLTFEKFLELRDLNTSRLKELEQMHERTKDSIIELYQYNNSFFQYAEVRQNSNQQLKRALEKAPKKISYRILELFNIKDNKVIIALSKEPFSIYAFHKDQVQIMHDVTDFIKASKVIGLTYDDLWPHVGKYLYDDHSLIQQQQTGEHGLSRDLSKVIFSFNKVLTYKI
ncbi:hypothetical protein [Mariniflexile maritimum]|uniref:hypothetical protein n=1 Tax=Mariniflexile maritimum TaxID=2682493 RepID=UPI0012F62EA7|nr:hypothetical protein [Mariniflexile maritimum]